MHEFVFFSPLILIITIIYYYLREIYYACMLNQNSEDILPIYKRLFVSLLNFPLYPFILWGVGISISSVFGMRCTLEDIILLLISYLVGGTIIFSLPYFILLIPSIIRLLLLKQDNQKYMKHIRLINLLFVAIVIIEILGIFALSYHSKSESTSEPILTIIISLVSVFVSVFLITYPYYLYRLILRIINKLRKCFLKQLKHYSEEKHQ